MWSLQLLTLAFFQDCIDNQVVNLGASPAEAHALCKADYADIAPIQTPNWGGENPFDTLTAAQVRAAIVGGVGQSNGWTQEQFEPLAYSNVGYEVPAPVSYNPTIGIRTSEY